MSDTLTTDDIRAPSTLPSASSPASAAAVLIEGGKLVQAAASAFVGPKGDKGDHGDPGVAGSDGADGADGAPGVGVPSGGSAGQILAKASGDDFDTEWVEPPGGGGTGAVDSVNGQTGAVVLDLEDVGASAFGAELAAVADAAAARTKIGVTATSLSANQTATVNSAGSALEARTDKVSVTIAFEVTADGTYVLALWPNVPTTLTEVSACTAGGTCSIKIQKGGADINGFGSAVALTTSVTDTASTETLAEDAKLTVVISSASSLTGIYVTLKGVRTGN